jgi:ribosome-binding factor A
LSQRTDRISVLLREAIQKVISKGLHDPRVSGLITVTEITTDNDLTQSTVSISVLPADRSELTLHGIRAAATHIRHQISNEVALRKVPKLVFKLDTTSAKQAEILGAIARATNELDERENQNNESATDLPNNSSEDADTDER